MMKELGLWLHFLKCKDVFIQRVEVFRPTLYPLNLYFNRLILRNANLEKQISCNKDKDEATRLFIHTVYDDLPKFENVTEKEISDSFYQICECFYNFIESFLAFSGLLLKVSDTTTKLMTNLGKIIEFKRKKNLETELKQREIEKFLNEKRQQRLAKSRHSFDTLPTSTEENTSVRSSDRFQNSPQPLLQPSKSPKSGLNPNAREYFPISPTHSDQGILPNFKSEQGNLANFGVVFKENARNVKF